AAAVYRGKVEGVPPGTAEFGPINKAPRPLGVAAREGVDEVDTVGVGAQRDLDGLFEADWWRTGTHDVSGGPLRGADPITRRGGRRPARHAARRRRTGRARSAFSAPRQPAPPSPRRRPAAPPDPPPAPDRPSHRTPARQHGGSPRRDHPGACATR